MTHSKTLEIEKCAKINGIISIGNKKKSIIFIKQGTTHYIGL
jgi:hypothetical protein